MRYSLTVNGVERQVDVPPGTTLTSVLRDDLGLTGTRLGCGHNACGACYVLLDGHAVASCELPVEEAEGRSVVTVEGLAKDGRLHPVQEPFLKHDAMQCGACTSGMLISAVALLEETPHPSEGEIREAMAPHLCRCGVYGRIVEAVQEAAR